MGAGGRLGAFAHGRGAHGRVVFRNGQVVVLQAEDGSRYQFPAGDVQSVSVAAPAPEGREG